MFESISFRISPGSVSLKPTVGGIFSLLRHKLFCATVVVVVVEKTTFPTVVVVVFAVVAVVDFVVVFAFQ